MNTVKAIAIPEGNVKSIAIGGVNVWNEPSSEPVDKYTWEAVFASVDSGTYATDYAIGDTVPLDLGTEGVINMQIAAFDTDDLADGSGKAPITWIAKELLKTKKHMNPSVVANGDGTYKEGTGTIGGWEKCAIRAHLKETIKPLIPANVRNSIKEVTKTHPAYNTTGTKITQTTNDDVWIPSKVEVFDDQYKQFFTDFGTIKTVAGTASGWKLRDAMSNKETYAVNSAGSKEAWQQITIISGICLCFCT